MDPLLNPEEIRLLELLESKDFDALTAEERVFVATQLPAAEYVLQRRILTGIDRQEDEIPQPRPLALPSEKSAIPLLRRTVPLYQAVLAIAAVWTCFFWLWPNERPADMPQQIVSADTIPTSSAQAEQTPQIVHDTVVRYVPVYQSTGKTPQQADLPESFQKADNYQATSAVLRGTELRSTLPLSALTPENIATSGTSLKEDQLSFLVPDIRDFQRR